MNAKRQTAGLAAYTRDENGLQFYMQMRPETAKYSPGTFGFFGGGMEEGETPLQTVVREIKEELTVDITEPEYFRFFEGNIADVHLFLLEVTPSFSEEVTVCEGPYGKFLSAEEVETEELMTDFNRNILRSLIAHLSPSE